MELRIRVDIGADGRRVVALEGAIDLQSRPALVEAAQGTFDASTGGTLVLDLSGVRFIDSTGIGAIVQLSADAEDAGLDFALLDPAPRVVRILELTGLGEAWPVEYPD